MSISYVADVVRTIERGDAHAGSFAFEVFDDVWSLRVWTPFREVIDMGIREVSVGVSFPAYTTTTSAVIK
jgi:phage head maturation protease